MTDEVFRVYIRWFHGFDLDGFDAWLESLDDCGAKEELQQRREKAYRAFRDRPANPDGRVTLDPTDADDILRHLEWMMLRRQQIEWADVAGPAARMGVNSSKTQRKRAEKRWAENKAIVEAIKRLATRPEFREDLPRELWPHLFALLEDMLLEPGETGQGTEKAYCYNGGTITYAAFRKTVERARK